jgi:predicted ATPase
VVDAEVRSRRPRQPLKQRSQMQREHLATGETVNIAARLEGLAPANTIVVSRVTARLLQDAFALDDLGSHELKGIADPMQLFLVLGVMQMEQALAAFNAISHNIWSGFFHGLLAEAHQAVGQPAEAVRAIDAALEIANRSEEGYGLAEIHRLKGCILLQQGGEDATRVAEACFHQALDIARRQHAKSWELRAAMSLARLWQSQGKRQAAYDLLAPVYDWFTEGFDTADLQNAKWLLEE